MRKSLDELRTLRDDASDLEIMEGVLELEENLSAIKEGIENKYKNELKSKADKIISSTPEIYRTLEVENELKYNVETNEYELYRPATIHVESFGIVGENSDTLDSIKTKGTEDFFLATNKIDEPLEIAIGSSNFLNINNFNAINSVQRDRTTPLYVGSNLNLIQDEDTADENSLLSIEAFKQLYMTKEDEQYSLEFEEITKFAMNGGTVQEVVFDGVETVVDNTPSEVSYSQVVYGASAVPKSADYEIIFVYEDNIVSLVIDGTTVSYTATIDDYASDVIGQLNTKVNANVTGFSSSIVNGYPSMFNYQGEYQDFELYLVLANKRAPGGTQFYVRLVERTADGSLAITLDSEYELEISLEYSGGATVYPTGEQITDLINTASNFAGSSMYGYDSTELADSWTVTGSQDPLAEEPNTRLRVSKDDGGDFTFDGTDTADADAPDLISIKSSSPYVPGEKQEDTVEIVSFNTNTKYTINVNRNFTDYTVIIDAEEDASVTTKNELAALFKTKFDALPNFNTLVAITSVSSNVITFTSVDDGHQFLTTVEKEDRVVGKDFYLLKDLENYPKVTTLVVDQILVEEMVGDAGGNPVTENTILTKKILEDISNSGYFYSSEKIMESTQSDDYKSELSEYFVTDLRNVYPYIAQKVASAPELIPMMKRGQYWPASVIPGVTLLSKYKNITMMTDNDIMHTDSITSFKNMTVSDVINILYDSSKISMIEEKINSRLIGSDTVNNTTIEESLAVMKISDDETIQTSANIRYSSLSPSTTIKPDESFFRRGTIEGPLTYEQYHDLMIFSSYTNDEKFDFRTIRLASLYSPVEEAENALFIEKQCELTVKCSPATRDIIFGYSNSGTATDNIWIRNQASKNISVTSEALILLNNEIASKKRFSDLSINKEFSQKNEDVFYKNMTGVSHTYADDMSSLWPTSYIYNVNIFTPLFEKLSIVESGGTYSAVEREDGVLARIADMFTEIQNNGFTSNTALWVWIKPNQSSDGVSVIVNKLVEEMYKATNSFIGLPEALGEILEQISGYSFAPAAMQIENKIEDSVHFSIRGNHSIIEKTSTNITELEVKIDIHYENFEIVKGWALLDADFFSAYSEGTIFPSNLILEECFYNL